MLENIIFDYQDLFYCNENPLLFLLKKEQNQNLRKVFISLNKTEKFIIKEIIIREKSIVDVSVSLNIKVTEVEEKLQLSLELLYRLFQRKISLE